MFDRNGIVIFSIDFCSKNVSGIVDSCASVLKRCFVLIQSLGFFFQYTIDRNPCLHIFNPIDYEKTIDYVLELNKT